MGYIQVSLVERLSLPQTVRNFYYHKCSFYKSMLLLNVATNLSNVGIDLGKDVNRKININIVSVKGSLLNRILLIPKKRVKVHRNYLQSM